MVVRIGVVFSESEIIIMKEKVTQVGVVDRPILDFLSMDFYKVGCIIHCV